MMLAKFKPKLRYVPKILIGAFFIFLLFFNVQIALDNGQSDGVDLFGLNISSFVSDVFATEGDEDPNATYPGGGSGAGSYWIKIYTHTSQKPCYKLVTKTAGIGPAQYTYYCYSEYTVYVSHIECRKEGTVQPECAPGWFGFDPNPPCGSDFENQPCSLSCGDD